MPDQNSLQRIRIQYQVNYPIQYIGQLDMQSVWERIFRRANLPVAYSQGFNPQPRLHLACALPLGFQSKCELVDVWLKEPIPVEKIYEHLKGKEQPGLTIKTISEVPLSLPALQNTIVSAEYICEIVNPPNNISLQQQIDQLLNQTQIIRQRRGKTYDLRPLIHNLFIIDDSNPIQPKLGMTLKTQAGATGRPDEVLLELGIDPFAARITRTTLHRDDLIKP